MFPKTGSAGKQLKKFKFGFWPKIFGQFVLVVLVVLSPLASYSSEKKDLALWNALKLPGHVALMRHAIAPGTGDPSVFKLEDCRTQRNLSEEGRDQARKIGARFSAHGITRPRIFSSQWCRCRETAELMNLSTVKDLPILNSFFQRYADRERQTQGLVKWLASQSLDGPLVLVTHQVNITALTNIYPSSGEIVVIHRSNKGNISVIGSIDSN